MNYYPEDIVNNMSLTELQNCDWDALFKQIQQPINNNYLYNNNSVITNNNLNTANDKAQVCQNFITYLNPLFHFKKPVKFNKENRIISVSICFCTNAKKKKCIENRIDSDAIVFKILFLRSGGDVLFLYP